MQRWKRSRRVSDANGSALLIAIMVMVVVTLLGITYLFLADTENLIARNERDRAQVLGVAEAGARMVKHWFDQPILEDITEDDEEKPGLLRSIFGTRKPRTSPARKADPILNEAAHLVVERGRCSVVLLQRRLEIGYTRASRLVETMEAEGLVGPLLESGSREIRMTVEEWEASS